MGDAKLHVVVREAERGERGLVVRDKKDIRHVEVLL